MISLERRGGIYPIGWYLFALANGGRHRHEFEGLDRSKSLTGTVKS